METIIKILIYNHVFFGSIGLLTGTASLMLKKGGKNHKNTGKIFSYSMIVSSLISLIISNAPNHKSLFLTFIGVFTIYLILAGNRALNLKFKTRKINWVDKIISASMIITAVMMLYVGTASILGFTDQNKNAILLLFFGGFGLFLSINDFYTFKTFTQNKTIWLINHIGRMIGALIATYTGFIVTALGFGSNILFWMLPTIVGTLYIFYWNYKVLSKKVN